MKKNLIKHREFRSCEACGVEREEYHAPTILTSKGRMMRSRNLKWTVRTRMGQIIAVFTNKKSTLEWAKAEKKNKGYKNLYLVEDGIYTEVV